MSAQDKFDDEQLDELRDKVEAMRLLLTAWNPTDEDVWDHPLMARVGEIESDYAAFEDDDFDDDDDLDDDDDE